MSEDQVENHLTVDHVVSVSKGGLTCFENCVTACRKCNMKKGAKTLKEAGMKLLKIPIKPIIDLDKYRRKSLHPNTNPKFFDRIAYTNSNVFIRDDFTCQYCEFRPTSIKGLSDGRKRNKRKRKALMREARKRLALDKH